MRTSFGQFVVEEYTPGVCLVCIACVGGRYIDLTSDGKAVVVDPGLDDLVGAAEEHLKAYHSEKEE